MKKIFKLTVLATMLLSPVIVNAADKSGEEGNSSKEARIMLRKERKAPQTLMPSKGLEAVMIFDAVKVTFRFPFDSWPAYVEISGEDSTYGYWSWTLADSSCSMPFDGESGDYCLKVSTPEGTYIGYFSLD